MMQYESDNFDALAEKREVHIQAEDDGYESNDSSSGTVGFAENHASKATGGDVEMEEASIEEKGDEDKEVELAKKMSLAATKKVDEKLLNQVMGMGFDSASAQEALEKTNGDVKEAVDLLVAGTNEDSEEPIRKLPRRNAKRKREKDEGQVERKGKKKRGKAV